MNSVQFEQIKPVWHDPRVPLLLQRIAWRSENGPRFVYKYRLLPRLGDDAGLRRLESIVLDNRLWLAPPTTFPDVLDGHIHYEVRKRGPELRAALERYFQQAGKMTSAQARRRPMRRPLSDLVANPKLIERMFQDIHDRLRAEVGICSMALTAREVALWDDYANGHRGVCFQFQPCLDPVALMGIAVGYSDDIPKIVDWFDGVDRDKVLTLLLKKFTSYKREQEYRIIDVRRTNCSLSFRPAALTGVIFGIRTDGQCRNMVIDLVERSARATGHRPRVYQAVMDSARAQLRFVGIPKT